MKQSLYILTLGMILNAGLAVTATAQDYSGMSTEDMVQLRSQVRYMSTNDRAAYRTELQSREQNMSREEKNLYRNMNAPGGGVGSDTGRRQGKGKGDGSGNKYRGSRSSSESGYGSGYESRQDGGSGGGGGRGRGRGH
jgi:hypothetical protein